MIEVSGVKDITVQATYSELPSTALLTKRGRNENGF